MGRILNAALNWKGQTLFSTASLACNPALSIYLIAFSILAAALAIPTWGVSLVVFWWLKRTYDKRTVSAILAKAVISMQEQAGEELFHVNHAAIAKVFKDHQVAGTGDGMNVDGIWLRWGVLTHPMIDEGRPFSLRLINRQGVRPPSMLHLAGMI